MIRTQVAKIWDNFIEETFKDKPNVKSFLSSHERKNLAIDKLVEEIQAFDALPVQKAQYLNRKTFEYTCREICRHFCSMAIEHKRQELLTLAEKQRLIDKAEEDKLFEEQHKDQIWEHGSRPG